MLSLDLTAAFDTIDHKILLDRLNSNFGISVSMHSWLSSHPSSFTTSSLPIMCRAPQGSVLGPILFSLYTAPIASLAASFGVDQQQFADDTQLFMSISQAKIDTIALCPSPLQVGSCTLVISETRMRFRLMLSSMSAAVTK